MIRKQGWGRFDLLKENFGQLKCLQKSYIRKGLVGKDSKRRKDSYWPLLNR